MIKWIALILLSLGILSGCQMFAKHSQYMESRSMESSQQKQESKYDVVNATTADDTEAVNGLID